MSTKYLKRISEPPRTRGAAHSHLTALIGKADDLPTADLQTEPAEAAAAAAAAELAALSDRSLPG